MRLLVLAASSSSYRRWRYEEELWKHGFDVEVVDGGVQCVERMLTNPPDVVLLEPSLLWGGSEGVLAVRAANPALRHIPVVLVAVEGVSAEVYRLARHSVQGFFGRLPTGEELAASLYAVVREAESCATELVKETHHAESAESCTTTRGVGV